MWRTSLSRTFRHLDEVSSRFLLLLELVELLLMPTVLAVMVFSFEILFDCVEDATYIYSLLSY